MQSADQVELLNLLHAMQHLMPMSAATKVTASEPLICPATDVWLRLVAQMADGDPRS